MPVGMRYPDPMFFGADEYVGVLLIAQDASRPLPNAKTIIATENGVLGHFKVGWKHNTASATNAPYIDNRM